MGAVNINNTGSGASVALSSDGTSLLLNGTAIGGGSSTLVLNNQTAAYTVVSGDAGKIINCSGASFTVSLTAAATLGSGFNCWIWNTGDTNATWSITIDPNASETIDGVATLILRRGEGTQIVCDGTNWQTGGKKTMRSFAENLSNGSARPIATGSGAIAIGSNATASNTNAVAIGVDTTASVSGAVAIGRNSATQGSQAVTGAGAMALGGSYASGADSFAAGIGNNTSSNGATQASTISIGVTSRANGSQAVALGYGARSMSTATLALGSSANATGSGSIVIAAAGTGWSSSSTASSSVAIGDGALSNIKGKLAYASGSSDIAQGTFQYGLFVLSKSTTDATPATLNSYNYGSSDATNQVILPNTSAFSFTGTVVARQSSAVGTASAAWKVEGLIRREANAGTTTLVASTVTAISNVPSWTLALSADTTNGGLAVTATGAAATNIRWVATIQTSECTYA